MRILFGLLSAVLFMPAAWAADPEALLQRFVDDVQTLSADFEQVQLDQDGEEIARRSGDFALARPGRFRWHYAEPYEQLMVCDGREIWNYEPDLAQVSVQAAGRVLTDTPAALLAEGSSLKARFTLEDGGAADGDRLLRLRPKTDDADFQLIELWLSERGVPSRMRFHDALGGTSDVRFSKLRSGAKLDPKLFAFVPPKGVDVVRLDAPAE